MTGEPRAVFAAADGSQASPPANADACIVLWMAGGMAAPDTFDPKRYHPYETGLEVSKVLGPRNPVMPAFINIGQRLEGVGESEELKAFTTAGFFGSEFGPMNLPFPEEAAKSVRPPKGMDAQRSLPKMGTLTSSTTG